ncbi:MAG TPA: phage tail protein [Bryobacteraceae bacterium]|nr:phage tail protein [Bryobacteraceae bacterium]
MERDRNTEVYTGRNLWGETEMHKYKLRMWDGEQESFGNLQTSLGSDSNVIDYQQGDNPISVRKLTGLTKYTNITLKRGFTQDSAFAAWAAAVAGSTSSGSEVPLHSYRSSLELSDEAGQPIVRYTVHDGWVSEQQLMPPGGVVLHSLHLRDGKTVEEKLWEILEESLSRLSHRP